MPLLYSQFLWGFEVFDSGTYQNNKLPFSFNPAGGDPSVTYDDGTSPNQPAAVLRAGVYTPDELADEVKRAINERINPDVGNCSFSYSTLKFTISSSSGNLSLLFGSLQSTNCNALLGFVDDSAPYVTSGGENGDSFEGSAVAAAPLVEQAPWTPVVWATAEPLLYNSPVAANPISLTMTAAKDTQRVIGTMQHTSDGGTVESVHFTTLRVVDIAFRALASTEKDKMESFLSWVSKGKRFTWQPDKTSTNGMKLVLSNPGVIAGAPEWLTRPETGYGTLSFIEQLK